MKKNRVGLGLYVVLILIVVFIWYSISNPQTATYTSSQFDKALAKGEVASAVIHQNEQVPTGSVTITTTAGGKFTVYVSDVGELQDTLDEAGVDYSLNDVPNSGFMESLLPMLIVVAVVFILFMMMMNAQAQVVAGANTKMRNFCKSRATNDNAGQDAGAFCTGSRSERRKRRVRRDCRFSERSGKIHQGGCPYS